MQSQLDSWLIHCATAVSLVLHESCNRRHVKCNSADQYSWGTSLLKVAGKIMFFFHRWDMLVPRRVVFFPSSEKLWYVHHLQPCMGPLRLQISCCHKDSQGTWILQACCLHLVIQFVTPKDPPVGGHLKNLWKGHVNSPSQKRSRLESPGKIYIFLNIFG